MSGDGILGKANVQRCTERFTKLHTKMHTKLQKCVTRVTFSQSCIFQYGRTM